MKESMFNIYYKAPDGAKLAFNSLSCGLAIVDDKYETMLSKIDEINDDNIGEELKDVYLAAREGNFIVSSDKNELAELAVKRNIQKYYLGDLALTIAPTLACNFKCVYCYESPKIGNMSKSIQEKLVDFIEKQAKHLNSLQINWYGGEPLLAIDVIRSLSDRFIEIFQKHNLTYNAFMISNGSLLNDTIINDLIKYHVKGIQITLDGPPEVHDSRRVSKNGVFQFNKIIENINKLLQTKEIDVVIRINVDKNNTADVEKLIAILNEKLIEKNVKITFGQVTAYTDACKSVENTCYNNIEFSSNILRYFDIIEKYGFDEYNEFPYPDAKLNYCCAEVANSFVVDFEGYFYKCWNEVGNIKSSIGNLNDENLDLLNYKEAVWLLRNPLMVPKCKECKILPICMGGCPYNTCIKQEDNSCDWFKYNLQDIVIKYYDKYQNS